MAVAWLLEEVIGQTERNQSTMRTQRNPCSCHALTDFQLPLYSLHVSVSVLSLDGVAVAHQLHKLLGQDAMLWKDRSMFGLKTTSTAYSLAKTSAVLPSTLGWGDGTLQTAEGPTWVRCILTFMGTYFPSSSLFLGSIPVERLWIFKSDSRTKGWTQF